MLYISKKFNNNLYEVYDTEDVSYDILPKCDILRLSKSQKILGVSGDIIKFIDPFKLYNKWKMFGVLDIKLKGCSIESFLGRPYGIFRVICVSNGFYRGNDSLYLIKNPSAIDENGIKEIIIPEGINVLANHLLANFDNLEYVLMPNTVKEIRDGIFFNCLRLRKIILSNNTKEIPNEMCYNCVNLTDINIPDSVEAIGKGAFYNCNSLKNITLSNNLLGIAPQSFRNCASLESIYLPDSLINLGLDAFRNCTNLKQVRFPESYYSYYKDSKGTLLGNYFIGCDNLRSLKFGNKEVF